MPNICILRDIYKLIRDFEVQFQQKYGLCLNEGMLLCTLKDKQYTSGEIAELLGLTCSNTSKIIKACETKGLILRALGKDDKRQMYFKISDAGLTKLTEIRCESDSINELLTEIKK
ncbi:MarR family winged helix-turn-helix transcriptional regulator [Dysgonomonas sp. 25]|uniref:MarR family winged helix-turn-helix transcriptional regulator n=1 Tax=Dysgonomonas sp. 25 TaxID=2302933 RepID=UPI0013D67723|nr:winged helix DNA-binding protein [Dysgonomonas sp. 25]NDV67811.1 MarR family transcriptional regulator [Dysgonomonas sp. 25]